MFHLTVYSEFELESFFVRNQLCFSVRHAEIDADFFTFLTGHLSLPPAEPFTAMLCLLLHMSLQTQPIFVNGRASLQPFLHAGVAHSITKLNKLALQTQQLVKMPGQQHVGGDTLSVL